MSDDRPLNCRFRLQEEGKAYPRSSCQACGKGITTGLGIKCSYTRAPLTPAEAMRLCPEVAKLVEAVEVLQSHLRVNVIGGNFVPQSVDAAYERVRATIAAFKGENE